MERAAAGEFSVWKRFTFRNAKPEIPFCQKSECRSQQMQMGILQKRWHQDQVRRKAFLDFAGDVDLGGNGILFQNSDQTETSFPRVPVQLQMYGVEGEDGRDATFAGNAGFARTASTLDPL